jgi:signal transduction histidine kinase
MLTMDRLRLRWKVFAFLLGFCALLLVILWLFQTVFLDAFYKRVKVMEIRRDAVEIANNAESANLIDIINDISENSDITIDIIDMDGRSLVLTFPFQDWRMMDENVSLITKARSNGGEMYEYIAFQARLYRFTTISGGRIPAQSSLLYVKMASHAEIGEIAIVIRAVISPVNATVTTLRYQLYFISAIMLFLAVVLAVIIAKRVSKPIEVVTQGASALAKGDYNVQFDGKGFYEIVALTQTLNSAAVELGRVEGLRRELLANVSHDLRTPLSLIYSTAEVMHDFPNETTPGHTQVIMDETKRLATLVSDILDISSLENDAGKLRREHFSITRCILETTERMKKLLENEGFEIDFSYDEDVHVDADKAKIDRAFYNLLINAINYSGSSRNVSIAQELIGENVKISVTDFGEGIEEVELPSIWDRYYKSAKAHKRAVTGTGLGLSIVKRVIESHGGQYGATSKVGEGSTFWFKIHR